MHPKHFAEQPRNNQAGWLRSITTFLISVAFLILLRKARTPAEGALLGVLSTTFIVVVFRLIDHWKQRPPTPAHQTESIPDPAGSHAPHR